MSVVDSLEDEMLVIDREYHILAANAAMLKRHRLTRAEVIGRSCFEYSLALPQLCAAPRRSCAINALWEEGTPVRLNRVQVDDVGGEKRRRYLDIIVSPIIDGLGEVVAITELMRDVTQAKLVEMKAAALGAISAVLKSALDKTLEIMGQRVGGILLPDEE